jgi:membrane protein YqaA with SNARE-associated domain
MASAPPASRARRLAVVLTAALLVPLLPFALLGELPGERWLQASGGGDLGFGLAGAGLLALDVALPIPSSVLGSLLGARLGFAAGSVFTFTGLLLGNLVGYALGRLLPRRFMSELPEAPTHALLFLSRPVPVLAEAACIAAGAERVPFVGFVVAVVLGDALYALAMAGNGAALLPGDIAGPGLVAPMLLPVAAYLVWQRRARLTPP